MRLFINDVLRCAGVQITMTLELEQEIETIYEQQDDTGTAADCKRLVVGNVIIAEGGVEGCR